MPPPDDKHATELRRFALAKMANVLGQDRARRLMDNLLAELGVELSTPHELLLLAERMQQLGGFEAAVGGMLGVAAVLRGATPRSPDGGERSSSTGPSRPSSTPR